MKTRTAATRWGAGRWACAVGAIAVGAAVLVGGSGGAFGQGAAASASALAEAERLNGEVVRLYREGRLDAAIPLAERALTIRENALGPQHVDVATSLNDLAELYDTKGDYGKAEPLYQRALAIREKVLGPESARW